MNKAFKTGLVILIILGAAAAAVGPALASTLGSRGVPGSPEFGFGATLYADGHNVQEALAAASDLGLDWIGVPVNWSAAQPEPGALHLDYLDPVMQYALDHQISVMLSISQVPSWAQTAQGPNPTQAAQFAAALINRYPAVEALELFPGANTIKGWGATADPGAYMAVYNAVDHQLKTDKRSVLLVAAGLQPLPAKAVAGDMDDLTFLKGMYQAGAAKQVHVISLHLLDLSGDPLALPSSAEQRVLRHYESVRRVMVENKNTTGTIWVTQLSSNRSIISSQDSVSENRIDSSEWISQGYAQLRAQLYMGVGFLQSLNSNRGEGAVPELSLVTSAGVTHPFYKILREMIALNKASNPIVMPGKAKDGNLEKKRP